MNIPSIEQLRVDAARGSASAATAAALRLLVGRDAPFEPKEAVELLFWAAEREDPDALCQVATIRATGAFSAPSWFDALDLLQQAAERGSARAQGQLRVLAHDQTSSDWRALRARVDTTCRASSDVTMAWIAAGPSRSRVQLTQL